MITTVTLNTSVDKLYLVERVETGTVMRVKEVSNTAGGKGLNVSKVAALAGEDVQAMGFVGGFAGRHICAMLREMGVAQSFTEIPSETRSCINIRNLATGEHTEFLEPGAAVTEKHLQMFLSQYKNAVPLSDIITISGSVPQGTPEDFYKTLVQTARDAGKPVILDTSGRLLQEGVRALPTVIKPNRDEIAQLLGRPADSRAELVRAATSLHESGIAYVVVSLGREGSLMVCGDGAFLGRTPDIPVVNTVGCGDSMVAGLAVGMLRGYDSAEMLRYATAVSTANALSIKTGHFEQGDLRDMLELSTVEKI